METDLINAGAPVVLNDEKSREVMRLAAVGLSPAEIAVSLELDPAAAMAFVSLAATPGSDIARAIDAGRAAGKSQPQIKLQEAASAGNIEAIRELGKAQAHNRFLELINNMDDDEFTV